MQKLPTVGDRVFKTLNLWEYPSVFASIEVLNISTRNPTKMKNVT